MAWWRPGPRQAATRWLVVDVEASGLDAARERLLAIAAVGLRVDWASKRLALLPGDSFAAVLRQDLASPRDNILLHGIGGERQRAGQPAAEALAAFREFADGAPLLAFHADFDRTLVERHARAALGAPLRQRWLDIAQLCAVSHPGVGAHALDEWLGHFGIRCLARHDALADALAEGDLLLRIWPALAAECAGWRDLERLAARHRWLPRT